MSSLFSSLFFGQCAILAVVGSAALAPEGHGEFPDRINGGAQPLVSSEVFAWSSVAVVDVDGIFPICSESAVEELIPSNFGVVLRRPW